MNQVTGTPVQQFMPLGEALMLADRYRGEGRLIEAEGLCRRVLETQPDVPEAEHLLGVIAHQNGKLADAIEHIGEKGGASKRMTDKMPSNYYFAGLIHLALPNAKIIHTTAVTIATTRS